MTHKIKIEIDDKMWKALGRLSSVVQKPASKIIQTMFDNLVPKAFKQVLENLTKEIPKKLDFPEIDDFLKG